jgi:hypothetical protein
VNLAGVEKLADAVLYEGYLLYPYRGSSLKNQGPWTIGVLAPPVLGDTSEHSSLQTECLLLGDLETQIDIAVRFLHPIARRVDPMAGAEDLVEPGREAAPVRIDAGPWTLGELRGEGRSLTFSCPASMEETSSPPGVSGSLARSRHRLDGGLRVVALPIAEGAWKLTVRVANESAAGAAREVRDLCSFVSAHAIVASTGGEFVSPLDPPRALREAAETCRNIGAWPILVGAAGRRDMLLCSPIILDQHPAIAPESPGDLFDGTEIDEILSLRILTLTEEEKVRMASADPRARALLERTEALDPEALLRMHGAFRRDSVAGQPPRALDVGGTLLAAGDRVRLRPQGRRDIFDLALAGRAATILSVEQDWDDRLYFTVTVDDDPGRDLGALGKPGHRFFFGPEEVEPWPGTSR